MLLSVFLCACGTPTVAESTQADRYTETELRQMFSEEINTACDMFGYGAKLTMAEALEADELPTPWSAVYGTIAVTDNTINYTMVTPEDKYAYISLVESEGNFACNVTYDFREEDREVIKGLLSSITDYDTPFEPVEVKKNSIMIDACGIKYIYEDNKLTQITE